MAKRNTIKIKGKEITVLSDKKEDYISLTDITKNFPDGKFLVPRWLRNKDTLEFLGTWEKMYNPQFRVIEFDNLLEQSGRNRFSLSISRWKEATGAIGFKLKRGRGASTFAHKDIALGFCYWLSPPFQLYLIKEFQRLKTKEAEEQEQTLIWSVKRLISKLNYKLQTDAIKKNLIPARISNNPKKHGIIYASEADVINVALFGLTAKQWRMQNPSKKGNMRRYASGLQLLVLSNLESYNAQLIKDRLSQDERVEKLNEMAINQLEVLVDIDIIKKLKDDIK